MLNPAAASPATAVIQKRLPAVLRNSDLRSTGVPFVVVEIVVSRRRGRHFHSAAEGDNCSASISGCRDRVPDLDLPQSLGPTPLPNPWGYADALSGRAFRVTPELGRL